MKIIMIANGMNIGGAETHILELSSALCEKGHSVTVASPRGVYTKELQKRGIRTEQIPRFDGSVLSLAKQMKSLFLICYELRPDILHAHTRPGALLSVLIGKILSIPVVGTAHLPFEKKNLYEQSTRWGDHVLAVSEDIAKHLIHHYSIAKNDIDIIRNGIDAERFVPKGKIEQKIVHISRLDRDRSKTADLLISLAPKLKRLNLCKKIVIVGDGDDFQKLQQKKNEINQKIGTEYVQMVGAKTDIEKMLENRPVFVGVSRAALEAMACECSVILCGNEGYDGILDEKKAEKAIKKNFCCRNRTEPTEERLLRDLQMLFQKTDEERMAIGHTMRLTVKQAFLNQKMAETAEAAYKTAIRKKGPGIILCGYYGYGNIGDETVLPLIIKKCYRHFERIRVMSRNPQKDQKKYGVKCIGRFSLFAFLKFFRPGDILVLGGGNLLQNQTSQRSLIYYLLVAALAKMKKGKIAIVRGGIGELNGCFSKKATKTLFKNCDYITCRTPDDLIEIKNSGGFQKGKFSADGSLLLPAIQKKVHFPFLSSKPYCVVVLKCTSKMLLIKKAAIIKSFCRKHALIPVFLAFDEKEDIKSIRTAASMIGNSIIVKTKKQDTIQRIISGGKIVLTDRLHAAYFALIANRPFAFLENTEKNLRHIKFMKRCFEKANVSSKLLVHYITDTRSIALPLTAGDHARVRTIMIRGGKGW